MPFVLKAGKALDDRKAEIRVQLRPTPHFVFGGDPETARNEVRTGKAQAGWTAAAAAQPTLCSRLPTWAVLLAACALPSLCACVLGTPTNPDTHSRLSTLSSASQLVVRLQPDEAIYLKMIVKRPGAAEEGGVWVQRSTKHSATVLEFRWPVNTGMRRPSLTASIFGGNAAPKLPAGLEDGHHNRAICCKRCLPHINPHAPSISLSSPQAWRRGTPPSASWTSTTASATRCDSLLSLLLEQMHARRHSACFLSAPRMLAHAARARVLPAAGQGGALGASFCVMACRACCRSVL